MDLQMPILDGFEATKKYENSIKIYQLSSSFSIDILRPSPDSLSQGQPRTDRPAYCLLSAMIISDARCATAIAGPLVFPETGVGMIEQSTTRRPSDTVNADRASNHAVRRIRSHGTGSGPVQARLDCSSRQPSGRTPIIPHLRTRACPCR